MIQEKYIGRNINPCRSIRYGFCHVKRIISMESGNLNTGFLKKHDARAIGGIQIEQHWCTNIPDEHYLYDQMIIQYT